MTRGVPCVQRAEPQTERDGVGSDVRKWSATRLNGFYCDMPVMYTPHYSSATGARTHIVLHVPPPSTARAKRDEFVSVGLQGLNAREALVKETGLNPHMSVCGWPFCLDDVDRSEVEW